MKRNVSTQADVVAEGERLASALKLNSADLAHLQGSCVKLESYVQEMQELMVQQDTLTSEKQGVSGRLQQVTLATTRLIHFLRNGVKEHYGPRNEKVSQFGLIPFRGRPRSEEGLTPPPPAVE
jgi:hypothetical protein